MKAGLVEGFLRFRDGDGLLLVIDELSLVTRVLGTTIDGQVSDLSFIGR